MAANGNNAATMEQIVEQFVGILERNNSDHTLTEDLLGELGDRVLSSQKSLQHDLQYTTRTKQHARDVHEAASGRGIEIEERYKQVQDLIDHALLLLARAEAMLHPQPTAIIYKVKCPTHGIDVDLEVRRTVTNNNVEYECPLKLSTTCSRGKKLTATWRNHMKKTCVPKLKQCPGHPRCSQGNNNNNNGEPTENEADDATTDN